MSVLEFHGAGVTYGDGRTRTVALAPTDLTVEAGQTVGVVGRSGAGKTTLAELALGLRHPSYGRITVDGHPWSDPHTTPPRPHRSRVQGVPQDALATLPPRWTVERTLRITAHRLTGNRDVVAPVVRALAVAQCEPELSGRRPHELSGGQAQRVAIARALVARPSVIVADEPTSALDAATAGTVVDTLFDLARTNGVAIVVVTHDHTLAARCDRLLEVVEGRVCEVAR